MATFEPTFASTHFGAAELGHVQRDRCPVEVAGLIHRHPGGTPPHKPRQPEDDKAMGRPMNRPEVAHAAVLRPHHQRALGLMRQAAGPVLVPHDTTELDCSGLDSIPELGSIGGDLGHNSLAFDPGRGGWAWPTRPCTPGGWSGGPGGVAAKRHRTDRESRLWPTAATAVGPAGPGRVWVHVSDRGSDTCEYLGRHVADGTAFVLRSAGRPARPGQTGPGPPVAPVRPVSAAGRGQAGGDRGAGRPGRGEDRRRDRLGRGRGPAAARPAGRVPEAAAEVVAGRGAGTRGACLLDERPAARAAGAAGRKADDALRAGDRGRARLAD